MIKSLKIFGVVMMSAATLIMAGCDDSAEESSDKSISTQEMQAQEKFPTFIARDLNGNQVNNDIFAKKKLTVINIWGTFCPPCIGEMPELGEWAKSMPADVQLIGLVCDIQGDGDMETINEAKRILNEANANFLNIVPNSDIAKYLQNVEAVPTTIFVDSAGNILNKKIVGADVDSYKEFVEDYLNAQN